MWKNIIMEKLQKQTSTVILNFVDLCAHVACPTMQHVRHAGHKSRCYCWLLWRPLRPARACELCEESVPSIPVSPPRPRLRHSARRRDTRNILWSETHQCPELRGGFLILSIVMEGGVNDKCCLSIYSLQKSLDISTVGLNHHVYCINNQHLPFIYCDIYCWMWCDVWWWFDGFFS